MTYSKRDQISRKFARVITGILPLEKVILFGSTAKRNDQIRSDLDICLVGKKIRISKKQRDLIGALVADYLINQSIVINWIYFNEAQWENEKTPIIKTIKKEGKILWEKEKTESKSQKVTSDLLNARKESDYNPLSWFEKEDAEEFYLAAEEFVEKMDEKRKELK